MDDARFDALTRLLTAAATRRTLPRTVSGLVLGGTLAATVRAETAAKKKKCGPCRKRKKGHCRLKPDGAPCGGIKTCYFGVCNCPSGMSSCGEGCIPSELCCPGASFCGDHPDTCGTSGSCRCRPNLAGEMRCGSDIGACGCREDAECVGYGPGAFCGSLAGCQTSCPPGTGQCAMACPD